MLEVYILWLVVANKLSTMKCHCCKAAHLVHGILSCPDTISRQQWSIFEASIGPVNNFEAMYHKLLNTSGKQSKL